VSGAAFMDPARIVAGGPDGLTRSLERLLPLLGFTQVVNIDGANDQGGDLLAYFKRELIAIQVKWRADPVNGAVSEDAVNEVSNAIDAYDASSGLVVTNGRLRRWRGSPARPRSCHRR
jgi:HJR/Mrr/RecB family endonuclease